MNRTKIEWCDFTWNPVVGCRYSCRVPGRTESFCYARRQAKRHTKCQLCVDFIPHRHYERDEQPFHVKKPAKIFVGSMCDLFGPWIPPTWIAEILMVVRRCPQHTFMFLTKNPKRYAEIDFPKNCWLGTTAHDFMPTNMTDLATIPNKNLKFVSIEPILSRQIKQLDDALAAGTIDWVIVGGMTGPKAIKPDEFWIREIVEYCQERKLWGLPATIPGWKKLPVFLKDNLHYKESIKEFPAVQTL